MPQQRADFVAFPVSKVLNQFVGLVLSSSDQLSQKFSHVPSLLVFVVHMTHIISQASDRNIVFFLSFELEDNVNIHLPEIWSKTKVCIEEIASTMFISEFISNHTS